MTKSFARKNISKGFDSFAIFAFLFFVKAKYFEFLNLIFNRIKVPDGYERKSLPNGSFKYWLRHLPLKKEGAPVFLYDGRKKNNQMAHDSVIDMAVQKSTGKKLFMLAQSYMPAQDIHILKNHGDESISPWYRLDFGDNLETPGWPFTKNQLKRFK